MRRCQTRAAGAVVARRGALCYNGEAGTGLTASPEEDREEHESMRRFWAAFGALLVPMLPLAGQEVGAPADAAGQVQWLGSVQAARQAGKQEGKPAMVHLDFDNCVVCQRYMDVTYRDPLVVELAGRFACVRPAAPVPPSAPPADWDAKRVDEYYRNHFLKHYRSLGIPGEVPGPHPVIRFITPDWDEVIVDVGGPPRAGFAQILVDVLEVVGAQARIRADKEDGAAHFALGIAYYALDDYEAAKPALQRARALDRGGNAAYAEEAELRYLVCSLRGVMGQRFDPTQSDTSAGLAAEQQRQARRLAGELGDFVNRYPQSRFRAEALLYRCAALIAAAGRDLPETEASLREVIAAEPPESEWRQWAEQLLQRMEVGRWQTRLAVLGDRVTPEAIELNFKIGHAIVQLGHYNEALPYLTEYLRYDPADQLGHREDARLDWAIAMVPGSPQIAILHLEEFQRQYPRTARRDELYLAMGMAYFYLDNRAGAEDYLGRVVVQFGGRLSAKRARRFLEQLEFSEGG